MPNPLDAQLKKNYTEGNHDSILNRGLNTTGGTMYFVNLGTGNKESGNRLEIQFIPSDINLSRKGNWAEANIIGRNDPRYQYIGGQTSLSFTLDFYADEESRTSVVRKVQWLQSLIANDRSRQKAPNILLVMGSLFTKEVWILASIDVKYDNLHRQYGYMPQQAIVDVELKLDTSFNTGWDDIRSQKWVAAQADGMRPIVLDTSPNPTAAKKSNFKAPSTRPYLGVREADDIDVGSGNDWSSIIKRVSQRYRLPFGADIIKDPGFNPGRIASIGG